MIWHPLLSGQQQSLRILQVKELLLPFGSLKAFNLVMDKNTGNSKVCMQSLSGLCGMHCVRATLLAGVAVMYAIWCHAITSSRGCSFKRCSDKSVWNSHILSCTLLQHDNTLCRLYKSASSRRVMPSASSRRSA